jgi:hypothetical protein
VTFSGHFVQGKDTWHAHLVEEEDTCLHEGSLTDEGSLTSPEFTVVFEDVSAD